MTITTHRVFYHVVGKTFLRGLVMPLFLVLLAVALVDTNTDWGQLREQIASLAPWQMAALLSGHILLWSVLAGRALRPAWRHPTIAFLVRQPMARRQWVLYLLPSLLIAFVPVVAIWWLAPHNADSTLHYAGFVGLAWPLILGASYTKPHSIALMLTAGASLTVLVFAYAYSSLAAYLAVLVTIPQLGFGVAPIPRQVAQVHKGVSGHLSGSGVVMTLLKRDLRCMLRTARRSLVNLAFVGILASLMMLALRVNGGFEVRQAFLAACILLSVAAYPVYESLERMKAQLGKEFMRQRWPVTFLQRSLALTATIAVLIGLGAVLIGSISALTGPYLLLFVLFAALTAVSSAVLFSTMLTTQRSTVGLFYFLLLLHAGLVFSLPSWGYAALAVLGIPLGLLWVAHSIRSFSSQSERTTLDQLA